MLKSELLELIDQGEGPKLEFDRDDVRPENLAKEIVAFTNMNGGQILMGVENDGDISGIRRNNLREWVMDTVIGRHVHPYIHPDYQEISLEDKKVAVIDIPMGTVKPYTLKHNDRQDAYVRYGNICKPVNRAQQARLYASGGSYSIERLPVPGSKISELSKPRYLQYFSDVLEETIDIDEEFLENRYFLVDSSGGLSCSYFAYALFAKRPGLRLPQAPVRVTVYPGNDKDYDTSLDESPDVPYVGLCNDEGAVVEPAIHERVMALIQSHISKEQLVDATRTRLWDYPPEAIREAIVNALVHRDWTKTGCVRLEVYGDRLEIHSPGSLPNGMTVDGVKHGARFARNQQLVRVFNDYGYMEGRGMGIRRKIILLSLKHSGREPDFEATEDHFKVILYKKDART